MYLALQGSSPGTMTAGILLLTRGRQLGFPVHIEIVGDPKAVTPVPGPCVVHAPVLASCGVGRDLGAGGTLVVGGPPGEPLLVSLEPHGAGGWFRVDRDQGGVHGATRAFVRLGDDARVDARRLGKEVRRAMELLGATPHPAVLDVLFGAPVPPLTRLAVALRCGRSMAGQRGDSITRYLAKHPDDMPEPLDGTYDRAHLEDLLRYGGLGWVLEGLDSEVAERADSWMELARTLAGEDGGRDLELLYALASVGSNLVQLPRGSMLPPLDAASDGVALCISAALDAPAGDANKHLSRVFEFLGGRFVDQAPHAHAIDHAEAPEGGTLEDLWSWFCSAALTGCDRAEELWPELVDPAS